MTRRISNVIEFEVADVLASKQALPPAPADSQALFDNPEGMTGDIALAPGLYRPRPKVMVGRMDLGLVGKVVTAPKTQIGPGEVMILSGSWKADGTLFKRTKFNSFLRGLFEARNSLFEECHMNKWGDRSVQFFTTKWVFENCVFTKSFIKPWKIVDEGVQIRNCTFFDIQFPAILYRQDAGKEVHNDWMVIKNCRFVGCSIPESLLIATQECVFEDCHFGKTQDDLLIHTPVSVRIYTKDSKDSPPSSAPNRTIEVLDASKVPQPAGATVSHRRIGQSLGFQ